MTAKEARKLSNSIKEAKKLQAAVKTKSRIIKDFWDNFFKSVLDGQDSCIVYSITPILISLLKENKFDVQVINDSETKHYIITWYGTTSKD